MDVIQPALPFIHGGIEKNAVSYKVKNASTLLSILKIFTEEK